MQTRPSRLPAGLFSPAGVVLAALLMTIPECVAEPYRLAANTKVQVSVVQWNATKAAYERWDAVGGEYRVSPDGTLSLPLLGSMDVRGQSASDLASEISAALRSTIGLLAPPAVSVEVTEYPPIYVVGVVSTPGQYVFRPGMTVLQAFALSGGLYRQSSAATEKDTIGLLGELSTVQSDILRARGRIARLEAEQSEARNVEFPLELTASSSAASNADIVSLEDTIFEARTNEVQRQLASLAATRELYNQELGVLKARTEATDRSIDLLKEELGTVEKLFERGLVTTTRRSQLEQTLAAVQVTRLSQNTELLKMQQTASELSRQALTIRDQRHTAIAVELRDAEADLDRLTTRENTLLRLLRQAPADRPSTSESEALTFTIVRPGDQGAEEMAASEITEMYPGDVLKVAIDSAGDATGGTGRISRIRNEFSDDLAANMDTVHRRAK